MKNDCYESDKQLDCSKWTPKLDSFHYRLYTIIDIRLYAPHLKLASNKYKKKICLLDLDHDLRFLIVYVQKSVVIQLIF